MKDINSLKVLLIQIREDVNVKKEELESFSRYSKIPQTNFEILDVFKTYSFNNDLRDYDAVFVGGASEASVLDINKYPFVNLIMELMLKCLEVNTPVFASCFGFQVAVLALGGKIITDKVNFEMGTIPIQISEVAKSDLVYRNINNNFIAVSVHQEKATELPKNCILLAKTNECIHSFKVINKNFWAFQFHPELDKQCLTDRLNVYKEKYTEDWDHYENIIKNFQETPESNLLLANFVQNVVLKSNK